MNESFDSLASVPNEMWRLLFDVAPVAMSLIDLQGNQIAGNAAYAELLGYTPEELAGLQVGQITREDEQEWTRTYLRQLALGEIESFDTVKTYVRRDGSNVTARLLVRPLASDGRVHALFGCLTPVDRRPIVTDQRLRTLVAHVHDTITLVDADGGFLETSGRYAPVLGYPPEFWDTRTIFDVVVAEDVERVLALRVEVLAEPGQHLLTEIRVRAADGSVEVLEVDAVNLLDDPLVGGVLITSRNVTATHEMVQALRVARDGALAEAEARSRTTAMVSHELRNPLHGLRGLVELLLRSDLPPEAISLTQTFDRQLRDTTRVIEDLLLTSELELGSAAVQLQPVVLRELIGDVVAIGRASIRQRPVLVSSNVSDDVPSAVMTDPVRVRQVLSNLVGNAVKFTDRGAITVRASVDPGGDLRIDVTDTGRGIAASELEAVFEPFRTGGNSRQQGGAGLGLSIVSRIATLLDGGVSVSSSAGVGSTFSLTLPLLLPASASNFVSTLDDYPAQPTTSRPTLLVLVVEDNIVNQQLARAQLQTMGVDCVIVGTGEEAVELLVTPRGLAVDLVLMDYHLPGIDGLETTRRIRALEAGTEHHLPIIGVTASATLGDRAVCLAAGMDDHLSKPVGLRDLSDAINRAPRRERRRHLRAQVALPGGLVDWKILGVLEDELGGHGVVIGLVHTFLAELPRRVAEIIDVVEADDQTEVRRRVHTLTSIARLVGALALATWCGRIEQGSGEVRELRECAEETAHELHRWLNR